eukprot:GGOE01020561.1.p1 GENE.GGOE01020561.1~~GGOE01020561.1.p1  ORF type:complete len:684 (+),score=203.73 GGOE01020561.1:58-2052(+)
MVHGRSLPAIADDIVRFPGSVQCTDAAVIRQLWGEVGQHVQNALQARKGIVLPEFGHFAFKRHVLDIGTLGRRITYQALFLLHPSYSQQHGLAARHTECGVAAGTGAVPTMTLNMASVGAACGLSRHSACCLLREICRRAGQLAAAGNPVALDFGVAVVHFHCQRYWAAWSPAFTQTLRSFEAQETTIAAATPAAPQPGEHQRQSLPAGSGMRSEAKSVASSTTPPSEAAAGVGPAKPAPSKTPSRIRAVAAVEERRTAGSATGSCSGPALAVQGSHLDGQLRQPPGLGTTAPSAAKDTAAWPPTPVRAASSAEPNAAIDLEDLPDRLNVTHPVEKEPPLSYKQLKLVRALRRLEKKQKSGALETWVGQMEDKEERRRREREEELQQGRLMGERIARENEAERTRRVQNRQQLQSTNRENEALSRLRDRSPRRYEMGTIFIGYQDPQAVKPDQQYLQQQIATKREALLLDKKKSADVELLQIDASRKEHEQREQTERQHKTEMKKLLAAALDEQIQANTTTKEPPGRYCDVEDLGGNFFFGPTPVGEAESLGQRNHKEKAKKNRAFFEESLRIADAARESRRKAAAEEKARDFANAAEDRKRFLEARAKKQEDKREMQQEVKSFWDGQRQQKKEMDVAKDTRLTDGWFAPRHIWRNDSSEDESP